MAERGNAQCRYAECRHSECRYAECRGTHLRSLRIRVVVAGKPCLPSVIFTI